MSYLRTYLLKEDIDSKIFKESRFLDTFGTETAFFRDIIDIIIFGKNTSTSLGHMFPERLVTFQSSTHLGSLSDVARRRNFSFSSQHGLPKAPRCNLSATYLAKILSFSHQGLQYRGLSHISFFLFFLQPHHLDSPFVKIQRFSLRLCNSVALDIRFRPSSCIGCTGKCRGKSGKFRTAQKARFSSA